MDFINVRIAKVSGYKAAVSKIWGSRFVFCVSMTQAISPYGRETSLCSWMRYSGTYHNLPCNFRYACISVIDYLLQLLSLLFFFDQGV